MKLIDTKSRIAVSVGLMLLAGTAWSCLNYLYSGRQSQTTLDAYVTADFTLIAPKVSGLVRKVLVEDNQAVSAGQALVMLDDRDFRTALESAGAGVEAAEADLATLDAEIERQPALIAQAAAAVRSDAAATMFARANAARYRNLSMDGAGTQQEDQESGARLAQSVASGAASNAALDATRRQLLVLQANRAKAIATLRQMEAARHQAQLNLSYTVVRAPIDGFVGRRTVRAGAYVNTGATLLAVVPTLESYIIANFQENQIGRMRLRQPAKIKVDSFPDIELRGHIDSLAPATDVEFAPIQPDNATGNFTKIVQRIPVKIVIDPGQASAALLRVGMSVIPVVNVNAPGGTPVAALPKAR